MIYLAIPGCVVAALGALIAAVAVFVATMQDKGSRAVNPRKGPRRARARAGLKRLWERLATFELPAPRVPVPAPRRPVNGRRLPDQPRRTPRPGPFTQVDMPVCDEPEPTGPARAWDPGDGLGPLAPIARPWTAGRVAYGVDRCELDVAEAQRHFAVLGPDGCEQA